MKLSSFIALLLVSVLPALGCQSANQPRQLARALQTAFREVYQAAEPGVVSIFTEQTIRYYHPLGRLHPLFGKRPLYRRRAGLGSGFVYNSEGIIVTNYHVAAGKSKIIVVTHEGKKVRARYLGGRPTPDLAIIKIPPGLLPPLKLADSDTVREGDWALSLGNPFGLSQTFTVGVVSSHARSLPGRREPDGFQAYIQTDAAINPGNSGGPLLNIEGEVIGINRMIYSKGGGSIGIGFAIPINEAREIIEEILN